MYSLNWTRSRRRLSSHTVQQIEPDTRIRFEEEKQQQQINLTNDAENTLFTVFLQPRLNGKQDNK